MTEPSDTSHRPTTETERPNLSTEHQKSGDARGPRDTLDRESRETPGGQPPEELGDRDNVGSVEPEGYPADERQSALGSDRD